MKFGSRAIGTGGLGAFAAGAVGVVADKFEGPWWISVAVGFIAMAVSAHVENLQRLAERQAGAAGEYPVEHVAAREIHPDEQSRKRGCPPPPLDKPYIGSLAQLEALEARLMCAGARSTAVVQAPRGSGATSLAVRFCEGREGVWFANRVKSVDDFFAQIADTIYGASLERDIAVQLGRKLILEATDPIIVLDDLDTPSVVHGIYRLLARVRILVTTSRMSQEWDAYDPMRLDPMREDDALELFRSVSRRASADAEDARALVGTLGCEPLAVRRAAEYLRSCNMRAADLDRWIAENPDAACRAISGSGTERSIDLMLTARFHGADQVTYAMDLLRAIAASGHRQVTRGQILELQINGAPARDLDVALGALESQRLIRTTVRPDGEHLVMISALIAGLLVTMNAFDLHRSASALLRARRAVRSLEPPNE